MALINCPQLKKTFLLDPSISLMDNLIQQKIPVASSCQGEGICAKCRVTVLADHEIPSPSQVEKKTMERNEVPSGQRLSCQLYLNQDTEVRTTYW